MQHVIDQSVFHTGIGSLINSPARRYVRRLAELTGPDRTETDRLRTVSDKRRPTHPRHARLPCFPAWIANYLFNQRVASVQRRRRQRTRGLNPTHTRGGNVTDDAILLAQSIIRRERNRVERRQKHVSKLLFLIERWAGKCASYTCHTLSLPPSTLSPHGITTESAFDVLD